MKKRDPLYTKLVEHIRLMNNVCVAFSGGVDSTLLLHAAHEALGSSIEAVTVRAMMIPEKETLHAVEYAKEHGFSLTVIDIDLSDISDFINNNGLRCYHCKKAVFSTILSFAHDRNIQHVIEGSHTSDLRDYRPGMKALVELGISSPFIEAGIDKKSIAKISRKLKIKGHDRPSSSCLATRIEYGTPIDAQLLRRIHTAEDTLRLNGFKQVRIRAHGNIARIEVEPESLARFADPGTREQAVAAVKSAGFLYVTLDLEGYRQGSMNSVIARPVNEQ